MNRTRPIPRVIFMILSWVILHLAVFMVSPGEALADASPLDVTMTSTPAGPVGPDTIVIFTASATGGTGSYEYRFLLKGPSTNNTLEIVQDYSTFSTWTWITRDTDFCQNMIKVYARDTDLSSTTSTYIYFTVRPTPAAEVILTTDPENSVEPGSTVIFTAAAQGGTGEYEYKFMHYGPAAGGEWEIVQDYSTLDTWTWTTGTNDLCDNKIKVYARSIGSCDGFDAYAGIYNYKVTPAPTEGVTLTASPENSVGPGNTVVFAAEAHGGSGEYEHKFMHYGPATGGEWEIVQDYSTLDTWTWTTESDDLCDNQIRVYVRSMGSCESLEAVASIYGYKVTPAPAGEVTLTVTPENSVEPGGTVMFRGTAQGGSGVYEYKFLQYGPATNGEWETVQDYSTLDIWTWTTGTDDLCDNKIKVYARSLGSCESYEAHAAIYGYHVTPAPVTAVTLDASLTSPMASGTNVAVAASAVGGTGQYEYQFFHQSPATGEYQLVQDYSSLSIWAWDVQADDEGMNAIKVYSRSQGSCAVYEAKVYAFYEVTTGTSNHPPDAIYDEVTTFEDTPVENYDVLLNDLDPDLDIVTVFDYTQPNNGLVIFLPNGTFVYTPYPDFNGPDMFTYTITDGSGGYDSAVVSITVMAINDPPAVADDSATAIMDTSIIIHFSDLLMNDTDIDHDLLIISNLTQPANGTVTNNGDNTLTYTPNTGFFGDDCFTYTADDGNSGQATANVTVTVFHPPTVTMTANPGTINIGESTTLSWDSSFADTVTIDQGIGNVVLSGTTTISITETTTYTITAIGPGGIAFAGTLVTVITSMPPCITIIEPDGIEDSTDCTYTIEWSDEDPDDNATISLYYDTDDSGADGILIVSGLSEDPDGPDDQYQWDTTLIPEDNYHVYAIIDDGTSDPVVDYSDGLITINHVILDEQKVSASDAKEWANYGAAVSISGDYAAVGAPRDYGLNNQIGAAYILKRHCHTWVEQAKLLPNEITDYAAFGASVAMDGIYAIVGAPGDGSGNQTGSAFVFKKEDDTWVEHFKLTAGDEPENAGFGFIVSISGDYAVVGAPWDSHGYYWGSAYVFKREGDIWTEQAKLIPGEINEEYFFGWSVSIHDDHVIVGALGNEQYWGQAGQSGSAYIYKREGDDWIEQTMLSAPTAAFMYRFGYSVAIHDNYAVVGSLGQAYEVAFPGSAFVYKQEGETWSLFSKTSVLPDDQIYNNEEIFGLLNFGISVSINDHHFIVGSNGISGHQSLTAYVYELEEQGVLYRAMLSSDGASENQHGFSVGLSSDFAIVGAPSDNEAEDQAGAVYIYTLDPYMLKPSMDMIEPAGMDDADGCGFTIRWIDADPDDNATISLYYDTDDSGEDGTLIVNGLPEDPDGSGNEYIWDTAGMAEGRYYIYAVIDDGDNAPVAAYSKGIVYIHSLNSIHKITAGDATESARFGESVAISGDEAIVGAQLDAHAGYGTGAAYILVRNGDVWVEKVKLTAGDAAETNYFGCSVSMDDDYAIIGAEGDDDKGDFSGSAYIFKRENDIWTEQAKLTAGDGADSDYFGYSVSIKGDYAVVGAYGDDDDGDRSGSAYIFKRENDNWIEQAKLTAGDAAQRDFFGYSVAMDGDYVIVGAYGNDDNGNDSGSAYIFKRENDTWNEQTKLIASDAELADYFGESVAISGDHVIVGAMNNDNRGAAYIFKNTGDEWVEETKLTPDEPVEYSNFGQSVSISSNYIAVGSKYGGAGPSVYVFKRDGASWIERIHLNGIPAPEFSSTNYGSALGVEGYDVIVGASSEDGDASESGSVYIYSIAPGYIKAEQEILSIGESTTLSWSFPNALSVIIDNGIGVVAAEGSMSVTLNETTTFTATIETCYGTTTSSITVAIAEPTIIFTAEPILLSLGGSSTLTWSTTDATSCTINPDIGSVNPSGSITVSPTAPTTYTLTATGPGGNAESKVTVSFNSPTASLSADPTILQLGESTTLAWSTTNAVSCSIEPDIDDVELSGSITVSPTEPTTYVITAIGPGGTDMSSVAISFVAPTVNLSASPEIIQVGESSTLTWSSTQAVSCEIQPDIGSVNVIGSILVSPTESTTYTIIATGPGGTATDNMTITAGYLPTVSISANPEIIQVGEASILTWSSIDATSCSIEPGIGSVGLNGSITVSPTEPTTYVITAENIFGTATTDATVNIITFGISITTPSSGDVIDRPDISVTGNVIHIAGNEIGVNVNGVVAAIEGNQFTANHVPMTDGDNVITATMVDSEGNMAESSITIFADLSGDYIRIISDMEAGISPLETTLRVEGSFPFQDPYITYIGPGDVEFLASPNENEYNVRMTALGIYCFTAEVYYEGVMYEDSITVQVIDQAIIDALLHAVWTGMKTALINGDIDGALGYHHPIGRDKYQTIYEFLGDTLSIEAQQMQNIEIIFIEGDRAKYRIRRNHIIDGETITITYYIYYSKDKDGLWKIERY
ncbi:MAG: tandem-95 repeat protein [Deltaproteobacteria bacterium]|nr:tandem-95 repeat protein [Deltaproteobacteria bacterium]